MIFYLIESIRDLFIGLLPSWACPRSLKGREFAFLCHPLDERDAPKKYPFTKGISKSVFKLWIRFFWPIIGAEIIGPQKKNSRGHIKGWVIICPLTPEVMLENLERARNMVRRSVRLCERLGVPLVSLGGYNSIITRDGETLLEGSKIAITTGNTYSTLLVIQNLEKVSEELGIDLHQMKVALIGAAGSVGVACAKILPTRVKELHIMDINRKVLRTLLSELNQRYSNVFMFDDVSEIQNHDIIITATSTPRAIVHLQHVRPGLIFIDASQPYNIAEDIVRERDDILVINSGIAYTPYLECKMDMGPYPGEVYACLGETLALVAHGRIESFSIGKVDPSKVGQLSEMVNSCGFKVAPFRNVAGPIPGDYLRQFKKKRLRRETDIYVP